MTSPREANPSLFPTGLRWTNEDWTTSEGKTREVIINGLPDSAKSACGEYVCIDGKQKLNGKFYHRPFDGDVCNSHSFPQMNKCLLPDEKFVQVQAYQIIDEVLRAIGRQVDIKAILGTNNQGVLNKIKAHIAGTTEFNAWYSRTTNDMTFGTGKGIWYLGGCIDIVLHEFGHYVLDHINPHLLSWHGEGGAIHEGFADFLASAISNDPEIGEDFVLAYEYYKKSAGELSTSPEQIALADSTIIPDKNKGLRTVLNDLTLKEAGSEVHDRGRAYGGFFWSLRNRLIEYSPEYFGRDNGREASTAILKLALHHCSSYQVNTPQPADFVEALLRASDRVFENDYKHIPIFRNAKVDPSVIKDFIRKEALKRGFTTSTSFENIVERMKHTEKFTSSEAVTNHFKKYYGAKFSKPQSLTRPFATNEKQLFYQQIENVSINGRNEAVEIIGHGFYERDENVGGRITKNYITNGIRNMTVSGIDTTVSLTEQEAAHLLFDLTTVVYGKLQEMNDKAKNGISESTLNDDLLKLLPYTDFRLMDANEMILRDINKTLSGEGEMFHRKFVVLPNENEISYEFRTKLASIFINAKTGKISIKSNIFIDNWMMN